MTREQLNQILQEHTLFDSQFSPFTIDDLATSYPPCMKVSLEQAAVVEAQSESFVRVFDPKITVLVALRNTLRQLKLEDLSDEMVAEYLKFLNILQGYRVTQIFSLLERVSACDPRSFAETTIKELAAKIQIFFNESVVIKASKDKETGKCIAYYTPAEQAFLVALRDETKTCILADWQKRAAELPVELESISKALQDNTSRLVELMSLQQQNDHRLRVLKDANDSNLKEQLSRAFGLKKTLEAQALELKHAQDEVINRLERYNIVFKELTGAKKVAQAKRELPLSELMLQRKLELLAEMVSGASKVSRYIAELGSTTWIFSEKQWAGLWQSSHKAKAVSPKFDLNKEAHAPVDGKIHQRSRRGYDLQDRSLMFAGLKK